MATVTASGRLRVGITPPIRSEISKHGIPDVREMARHVELLGLDGVQIPDLVLGDGLRTA